jgi:hypothetical protein
MLFPCYGIFRATAALNLLLIILLYLCSRSLATWQWHSAPLKNTEFWLEFCHGWPLVISFTSYKYKCFMPAACVDSSLQLDISAETNDYLFALPYSVAETIHTASHFKLPSCSVQNMNPRPSLSPKHGKMAIRVRALA